MLRALCLLSLCLLAACTGSQNVRPGGEDYPALNPQPSLRVHISAQVPAALQVSFTALWQASNRSCRYYANGLLRMEGAPFNYSVTLPLAARRTGNEVNVPVTLDEFQPGPCGWALSTVKMLVTDGETPPQEMDIYYASHRSTSSQKAEVWCTKAQRVGESEARIFCSFLNPAPGYHPAPSSLSLGTEARQADMVLHYRP